MPTHVVVLGAGFGGLELSSRLSTELGDEVDVTLIDRSDSFVFGFSKLDVLFGRAEPDVVRHHYRDIAHPRVAFRQETIETIDPATRTVVTDGGTYEADVLVVALGADLDLDATAGLRDGYAHEFYSVDGARRARHVVADFARSGGGRVVVGILGPFFKCPPAPFETAFMMDELLGEHGVRGESTITILSPLPAPIPISQEASAGLLAGCAEHGVEFVPQTMARRLEKGVAHTGDDPPRSFEFDLFLAIPVHRAPRVVEESGLTVDGWIAVDAGTLETRFADVYAVGDVTSVPVPRAGVFAEGEAAVVAQRIAAKVRGETPSARYGGTASCYIEWGDDKVARVDVDFVGGPAPTGRFNEPSSAIHAEKQRFATDRRARWFDASS